MGEKTLEVYLKAGLSSLLRRKNHGAKQGARILMRKREVAAGARLFFDGMVIVAVPLFIRKRGWINGWAMIR